MDNRIFRKGLVVGVIFLFLGIAVQPITSVGIEQYKNSKQTDIIVPLDDIDPKEYLFETIIQIANNPEIKELIAQYKGEMLISDYDFKEVFKQLLIKNPRLLFSMIFTKPSISYIYLEGSYNKGVDFVNIVGEGEALNLIESTKINNPDILNDLNNIIINNKELSDKISTLEIMNNDLKPDSPLEGYPIICAILALLDIIFISLIGICLMLILMMPGKLLWSVLTGCISIFFVQFYIITYIFILLQCIEYL